MHNKIVSSLLVFVLCFSMIACTVDQALADINVVLQMANALAPAVALVSPPDAVLLGAFITTATAGINLIKQDYDTWKASGATTDLQKLQAAITTFNNNLPAELAAAHVQSPAAIKTVTAWDAVITSTLSAVLALLPQLTSANSLKAKAAIAASSPVPLTPEGLQARWSAEICGGEAKCSKLVVYHKHSLPIRVLSLGIAK
jgi:hypothetical protein